MEVSLCRCLLWNIIFKDSGVWGVFRYSESSLKFGGLLGSFLFFTNDGQKYFCQNTKNLEAKSKVFLCFLRGGATGKADN